MGVGKYEAGKLSSVGHNKYLLLTNVFILSIHVHWLPKARYLV